MKNDVFWLYCQRCGWQSEEPNCACAPICPDCWARLHIARLTTQEFDTYERQIKASVKKFVNSRTAIAAG
jgi:hypothetical protein